MTGCLLLLIDYQPYIRDPAVGNTRMQQTQNIFDYHSTTSSDAYVDHVCYVYYFSLPSSINEAWERVASLFELERCLLSTD